MLTAELVPSTCWYTNVRSNVSRADWEKCKKFVRDRSGAVCEICSGQGRKWAVECHEIWEYDDVRKIQKLVGLIALCPDCHKVKHIGRTSGNPQDFVRAIDHLAAVNSWSLETTEEYLGTVFQQWQERSQYSWTLDITYLNELGIEGEADG